MKEKLEEIARLVMALPHSNYPTVSFGTQTREAVEALFGVGAARRATVYDGKGLVQSAPYVIESAEIRIEGVRFEAQYDREPTAEEVAKLADAPPGIGGKLVRS